MKIRHTKILASSNATIKIPSPFDKWYRLASDEEIEDYTGFPARPTPCEEANGYDIKCLSWVIAKDPYMDALGNNGLDTVELVSSGWHGDPSLAYVVGDRIYPVDLDEVQACLDSITGAIDTGLQYWYFSKHGLGPGMMPSDVNVVDVYEDGWKTWFKTDKLLTTEELLEYELKEEWPPEGAVTRHGEVIEGATAQELQDAFNEYTKKQNQVSNQLDELQDTVLKKAGLFDKFRKKKTVASECREVAQDADSIHYVVASDDEKEDWIVDYDIPDDPSFLKRMQDLELADEDDYYDRLHGEGKYEGDPHDIYGAEELSEDEEDFLDQPDQEFKSDKTAVNGKQGKLPAVFKKATIPNGALVLDYGGGTAESEAVAQAYLDQFNATEMLYDPFNQTAEHNRDVVRALKSNSGADVAVCSNVLNVIKEQEVRFDVLSKIKKLMKPGAVAFITVYEGSGAGEGSATQNNESFQNNKKLGGYLEEIQQIFPQATKKGSVIVAPNVGSSVVESNTDISSIDLDVLRNELAAGCEEYLTGPKGGFLPSGSPKEDRWEITADEVYNIDVTRDSERIRCEVRAELSYDGMMEMTTILDKVVQKYDSDSYFDMDSPGIAVAFLLDQSVEGSTTIEAASNDSWNDDMVLRHDRYLTNPPEDSYGYDEELEDINLDFDFDIVVIVDENGDYNGETLEGNLIDNAVIDLDVLTEDQVADDANEVIIWSIPTTPGTYHMTGKLKLVYKPEYNTFGVQKYACSYRNSKIEDLEVVPAGKLESSKKVDSENAVEATSSVEAAMTDEDVEYAILNGKPFELDAFKRYYEGSHDDEIKASQIEVGDVFASGTADVVDYGTVLKVLSINDEQYIDPYFDLTFHCEVVKLPERSSMGLSVGDVVDMWFDKDEYVGTIVPV